MVKVPWNRDAFEELCRKGHHQCDQATEVSWKFRDSDLCVELPILLNNDKFSPLLEATGPRKRRIRDRLKVKRGLDVVVDTWLDIYLNFEPDRREVVAWQATPMASAGLPSLGRRR